VEIRKKTRTGKTDLVRWYLKFKLKTGSIYEGYWNENMACGKGTFRKANLKGD
jgi:hypothetical protein